MRLASLRRRVPRHPRALAFLLLAFAIQSFVLPSVLVGHHRHASSAGAHLHVGHVLAGTTVVRPNAPTSDRAQIARAPERGLHYHTIEPLLAVGGLGGFPTGPTTFVTEVSPRLTLPTFAPGPRPGLARAPPFSFA